MRRPLRIFRDHFFGDFRVMFVLVSFCFLVPLVFGHIITPAEYYGFQAAFSSRIAASYIIAVNIGYVIRRR